MATRADHSLPDAQFVAVGERLGLEMAQGASRQSGTFTASLNSAGGDDIRAESAVTPLDRLLELPLESTADFRDLAGLSEAAYPAFHDDDLPAPSFDDKDMPSPSFHDDDLSAPSFHDDDLPAPSLHDFDMPADLSNFGLDRLLGLQLSGAAPPTVGEVVSVALRSIAANETEPKDVKNDDGADELPAPDEGQAGSAVGDASDSPFIDPQSFTEQAATNNAKSASGEAADGKIFGLSLRFSAKDEEVEFDDDLYDSRDPGDDSWLPQDESGGGVGGGGGGGGANVINGSAGDDVLIGTAGEDRIHGLAGADILDGGAGGDWLDGGSGDDALIWDSADTTIDGKNGIDTLRVDSGDADFTIFAGAMSGLEIVDLHSDAGPNVLTLTAQNVIDATDNANTLTITGDTGDILAAGNGWTDGGVDGGGNQIYTQIVGAFTATLVVDPDITPNATILL